MPIYEYHCQSCHKLFEYFQNINDPLRTECEACHGKLEKLVSSTSFQLKGTGWYATDFKNGDKKAENKAETSITEQPTQENKTPPSETESAKKPTTESNTTTKEQ